MDHPVDVDPELSVLTTVLNKVRPTVVVRRRVYEVARAAANEAPKAHVGGRDFVDEDDDDGPPSSVNVARALASLRGDELRRLEEILSVTETSLPEPDETDPDSLTTAPVPAPPSVKTLQVAPTISLPELARRLSVTTQELVTTLVTRGFFSVTPKSVLSRDTARAAAWMFGWVVEDALEAPAESKPKLPKKKAAAKKKATTKAKRG